MRCYIADTVLGIFVFDETDNPIGFRDYEGDLNEVIELYDSLNNNILPQEFRNLLKEIMDSGYNEVVVDNSKLSEIIEQQSSLKVKAEVPCKSIQLFKLNLSEMVKKFGIQASEEKIGELSKSLGESLTKKSLSRASASEDLIITQKTNTLDLLKKTINLFSLRIREWYGLHFPELTDKLIEDHVVFNRLISQIGERKEYTRENLVTNFSFSESFVNNILTQAQNSMGGEIDLKSVKTYADLILSIDSFREFLERELEDNMKRLAPNLTALVGPLIGSKLIAVAGGMRKLALLPASTIQLLGAEKALFMAKKTSGKSPKHGVIFQWHGIRSAKPWQRGKISRLLSGKISIAVKVDYFSDKIMGEDLVNEVNRKIEEIKFKYPNPPKKQKSNQQQRIVKKKKKKQK